MSETIESLKRKIEELEKENKNLKSEGKGTLKEEDPSLSFELVEMYEEEENRLIKKFMDSLPLTMKEEDKYKSIMNTFFFVEQEVGRFHLELEKELSEVLEKREKKIYPLTAHKSKSEVMEQFSILYFLLQRKNIIKHVVRRTKLDNSDFLKRHLYESHIIDVIYAFYRTNVKFDEADKKLAGKMFKEDSCKRYGKCEGFVILACISPSLFEKTEGELVKEAVVITKQSTARRGPPRAMMMMKKSGGGGLGTGGLNRLGDRSGGMKRGNLAKAVTSFNLGAKIVETTKTRDMDMKKREAAVSMKEEKVRRKEEKLRLLEEDLKRKEEALTLFEKDLHQKEGRMEIDLEARKMQMQKSVQLLVKRKEERLRRRKEKMKKKLEMQRIAQQKKFYAQSVALSKMEMNKVREKFVAKEEEANLEEEEKGCPKEVDEIVKEYMDTSIRFSGISSHHFSFALSEENFPKNRTREVLPYNHNFVNVGKKGYINASDCRLRDISYIAAQWPLVNDEVDCVDDFYDMIYRHKCKVIVSLQKPRSPNYQPYWPKQEGEMKITEHYIAKNVENEITPGCQIVKCQILKKKKKKKLSLFGKKKKDAWGKFHEVTIFLYGIWPEDGLPEGFDSLKKVMTSADKILMDKENYVKVTLGKGKTEIREAPMLVHCGTGVGRTGVFIACHNLLRMKLGIDQIQDTFFSMTKLRNHFIQNVDQYRYCYDFVWKYTKN